MTPLARGCTVSALLYVAAMPELAEVEFNRKQWDAGLGAKVLRIHLHERARVFLGTDTSALRAALGGALLQGSEAHGKRMLFHFSRGGWLGVHLGMTGRLRAHTPAYQPARHDHLVLFQARRALVFADPRQFGRVQFQAGQQAPGWWQELPPTVTGPGFTREAVTAFLNRHARLPIKGALLLQTGFPGIGNWMADEILWRIGVSPRRPAGQLSPAQRDRLWRTVRWVSQRALATVGVDYSNLPRGWLFHERWSGKGECPRHRQALKRESIGGRTTAWCARCQK
jgi:formamidopyrimidine-DNA glycosylase